MRIRRRQLLQVGAVVGLLLQLSGGWAWPGEPLQLPTPTVLDQFKNFARATVSGTYDSSATTVSLFTGQGANLAEAPFSCTWYQSTNYPDATNDPQREIVRITAKVGDQVTVVRGWESTTPVAHNQPSPKVYKLDCAPTADTFMDIGNALAQSVSSLNIRNYGATGDGTTDDTAAIAAVAAFALGPSGTCQSIYAPAGNYKLTSEVGIYNTVTPGAKDCGVVFGEGQGTRFKWYGPYYQSPFRLVGSYQSMHDLAIDAVSDWIAGIDYSGSNTAKVGTVSTGRTTTASLTHVWIDTNNFHGDGVAIGRYAYQSDMLLLDQVYIRDCIHGNGVQSYNSNTQSMKYMGGVISHCHVAFGKNTTTNFSVFGTEIDSNDLNFSPSGGGTIVEIGGRTENAKRFYFDNNGTSGGPRNFDGVQASNWITARPTTTATTYTTLATPSSPSVVATGSGSTTWGYKIACFDAQTQPAATTAPAGHTASTSEVTVTNAATLDATHFNTINLAAARSAGASSCGVYRATAGTTPSSIGTIAFVPYWSNGIVVDNGLPADSITPPTTNTTSNTIVLSVAGMVEGDNVALDGGGGAATAGVHVSQITNCYDLLYCHLALAPTVDVVAGSLVMLGVGCTAAMTASSATVTLTTPCVPGNATFIVAGAGVAAADLTTILTAASCTFPGSPHTMVCTGSVAASTTVTGALVKSTTNVYWQNFFIAGQSGPYNLRGNIFQATTGMQHAISRSYAVNYFGNYWRDGALADPLGRRSAPCTFVAIGNLYGEPPAPMQNCIVPSLPFLGATNVQTISTDLTLGDTAATYQFLTPTGAGISVILTPTTNGAGFLLKNEGTDALTIKDGVGATITSLAGGSAISALYSGAWKTF